jgi:4-amino-4-deoxy-L-arabinose transferase-like glycosyltransferase
VTLDDALLKRWPLVLVLALSASLAFGIFGRNLWKPDEPREAAIAGRMARPGGDLVVPHLGEQPFCEKPPLYYWVATGSVHLLGPGPVAVRVPNLLYALAGALLVGLLAQAAAGRVAALAAGALMGTFYLAWRVEVWIATDALLMATVAGALLGCYRGLTAARGWPKLGWYTLMHVFLAVGFLTKNVVAWMVPALGLVVFVAWERRWRELLAWELYAGLTVQLAAVLPWVLAVAARPDGATYLRIFFVDNLVGRFTRLEGVGYTEGHRGWLGEYLVELPVYLLPWTFLIVAAVAEAWRASRKARVGDQAAAGERPAWRYAIASVVPALLLLSASTTKRDIYAAVLMPGFALLGGLWISSALRAPRRLDLGMVRATGALLVASALLLPPSAFVESVRVGAPASAAAVVLAAAAWLASLALAARLWSAIRGGRLSAALLAAAACWVLTMLAFSALFCPMLNRSQDLAPVAGAARDVAAEHPLAIWDADETIIAVLDFYAGLTPPCISGGEELRRRLAAAADLHVLTEVTTGAGKERRLDDLQRGFGLEVESRIDLPNPGGRSYAILKRKTG